MVAPRTRPVQAKPPASPDSALRLQVEIQKGEARVVAFVVTADEAELAQRIWSLTDQGIATTCYCEKGPRCPSGFRQFKPKAPAQIEAQLEAEIAQFQDEYRIPKYRIHYLLAQHGELLQRLPKLALGGRWKDRAYLTRVRESFSQR